MDISQSEHDKFPSSKIRDQYQEKSYAPEIRDAANLQMYDSNGLKLILNLDFRGVGQDRESEGDAQFSWGGEMWKVVRPGY